MIVTKQCVNVRLMWNYAEHSKECVSQHNLYDIQHIHINLTLIYCAFYRYTDADQN